ncbi:hypothetical protein [Paractinoplanes abujensis]|uniref:Lipoprotein n=1 Tax=Paractinoplanes abujensis TaxID=882441 RepID=A0A7W7CR39_9ACTN|nr:hypothetical protein [Actinoplanes abujensis]MBB4691760.1 hypothetical protein [Actinoplanes abujensis]
MLTWGRIAAGLGLVLLASGCGGQEPVTPERTVEVCTAAGDAQAKVEFRRAGTVVASGSVAAGGSFAASVAVADSVDAYVDGMLLGTVEAGSADVRLGCPAG